MTTNEKLLKDYEDDPDCGVDAASDKGYWLDKTEQGKSDHLIARRKEAGLSPELLSELAPIPLEEYFQIEKGERTMTNGDAWRIDAAIINYRLSKETWLQRKWRRGWLARCRNKFRMIRQSDTWRDIIPAVAGLILYWGMSRRYVLISDNILTFFLHSAFTVGIPACIVVWLLLRIIKGLRTRN